METVLIGVDDTDVLGSTGTGRMARDIADYLTGLGLGRQTGVTRHQLLVDERIPYTSHNSTLCIGFVTDAPAEDLRQPCIDFLNSHFREGYDPGLCISWLDEVRQEAIDFGCDAGVRVLNKKDAVRMAAELGMFLVELGGTGGGIIGALAAVGLRAGGGSGRYIDLAGIRDIAGMVTVEDLLERTDIEKVHDGDGHVLGGSEIIDSRDWIRPSLVGGKPVLRVHRHISDNGEPVWRLIEKRQKELLREKGNSKG